MSNAPIRIGHYRLGKTLGVGSFGKVKLAEHELTGHKVAVKILNRQRIRSLDMDEKVKREIKILKLFRHPHIISLYEVIDTPTDIFVVMEYICGGELFDYIVEKGRLSEDEARAFFQQIISGVEYCHRHMVVHRDLKPENLLLDSEGNVKIADFGLSNIMTDGHFLKTSCGSPNYAAPEVISGKLYAGPEVDVWSCGVILYALLCGSLPFDDENIPNLFKKIKGGIYTLPSHLSTLSRDLIPRMLVVDPLQRITIADIRKHPFFTTSLPPYLAMPYTDSFMEGRSAEVDDEVLEKVVQKVGFSREKVEEAVRKGQRNHLTVAYYLVLDHKKRIAYEAERSQAQSGDADIHLTSSDVSGVSHHKAPQAAPSPSLGPVNSGYRSNPQSPYIGATPQTFGRNQASKSAPPTSQDPTSIPEAVGSRLHRRYCGGTVWCLGAQASYSNPADVMYDVYGALKALNFEWKQVNQYSIKCRTPPSLFSQGSNLNSQVQNNQNGVVSMPGLSIGNGGGSPGLRMDMPSVSMNQTQLTPQPNLPISVAMPMAGTMGALLNSNNSNTSTQHDVEMSDGTNPTPSTLSIGLQLYKVHDGCYLLDIQKIPSGASAHHITKFMQVCDILLRQLKVSGRWI